jgi:hypothetical protein
LDLAYSEETTVKLPEIMGGLSHPNLKTQHWEIAYQLFDLLL